MAHTKNKMTSLKVFLFDEQDHQIEVRRFGFDQTAAFSSLQDKLKNLFPLLQKVPFKITWKDSEGDDIIVSSNEELLEALSGDSDCYKLHVTIVSKECIKIENKPEQDSLFAPMPENGAPGVHSGVTCDGCEKDLVGTRFKCLQCEDYDLCRDCEATGIHNDHVMLRFCKPIARNKAHRLHRFCYFSRRLFNNGLKVGIETSDKHGTGSTHQAETFNLQKLKEMLEGFFNPIDFDLLLCGGDENAEPTVLFSTEKKKKPESMNPEEHVDSQTEDATANTNTLSTDGNDQPVSSSEFQRDEQELAAPVNKMHKNGIPIFDPATGIIVNPEQRFEPGLNANQPTNTNAGVNEPRRHNLYPNVPTHVPTGYPVMNNQGNKFPYYTGYPHPGFVPTYSPIPHAPTYPPYSVRNGTTANSPFLYSTSTGTASGTQPTFTLPRTPYGNMVTITKGVTRGNPIQPNAPVMPVGSTNPFALPTSKTTAQLSTGTNPPLPTNLPEPLVPTPATTAAPPRSTLPRITGVPTTSAPSGMTPEQHKEIILWNAVENLVDMGFNNDNGYLYHVLQLVDGNVDRAIERILRNEY